jgi:hypothetical protein
MQNDDITIDDKPTMISLIRLVFVGLVIFGIMIMIFWK